jgi:hypothetical protein
VSKREPQIILKTEERSAVLELGHEGKFVAPIKRLDETRLFLEGNKLEVAVKNGRWVLTRLPAGPRPAVEPVWHYFDTEAGARRS